MINHISIAVHNPEQVAGVLAELWGGFVIPFPPAPNSFMVLADDGRGSAVEVTPIDTVLVPGEGFPPEENFDSSAPTEKYEAKFVKSDFAPQYVATHLNINTQLNEAEVKAIAKRENWRVLTCNRGEGLFQLIELWIEDRFMLEVMTPEQTARYVEVLSPEFISQSFGIRIPAASPVNNLSLIG
ncbi:MAG: hypothetical protein JWN60_1940 [Acidobacteria bacterium]|jgi:hypothetical protein|nr:hypothetical protein [Acidobacteriota bacterium]